MRPPRLGNGVWFSSALAPLVAFLMLTPQVKAYPPPVELESDVQEAETHVISSTKAVSYSILLPHVPTTVTAEDFSARVIANKVLKISVQKTPLDWHFRLAEEIPQGIKLVLPVEVERRPGDYTGAVWRATVVVPAKLQRLQSVPAPKEGPTVAAGGAASVSVRGRLPTETAKGLQRPFSGLPREYPFGTGAATGPSGPPPRHREKPLPSASVSESLPLPSFDN